jgi:copper chaperone CopZ
MTSFKTNWTKEELQTYVLIYCANADFTESKVEINFIKSEIEHSDFDKIHAEFEEDNDYQSIQKIQQAVEDLGYSNKEKNQLFEEIRTLFKADKKFDILEKNVLRGLKKILK